MSRRKAWFVALGAVALVTLAAEHDAGAVPNTPPPGYPYTSRIGMVASTTVAFSDPVLTGDGYSSALVSSDITGHAVTIQSTAWIFTGWGWDINNIDYYTYMPDTLSNGAPDNSYLTFDYKDPTGEYAGVEENSTWVDAAGLTWYYFFEEINGEDHYIYFNVDSSGNVNQSSLVQVKGRRPPDRCKIMSDTGALQCPRNANGIGKIPRQIRSFLAEVGWFDSTLDWTWSHIKSAGNDLGNWLSDPTVQYVLESIGIIAGVLVCCVPTFGTACVVCVTGGFALMGAATGQYVSATNNVPTITNTSSYLRAAGVIGCSGSACSTPITCGAPGVLPSGKMQELCEYTTTTDSCVSPFFLLGTADCLYIFQWQP